MNRHWDPSSDHMTTVVRPGTKKEEPLAVVAWRGPEVVVVEIHEILETGGDEYFPFVRETRVFQVADEYPQQVPEEVLNQLLTVWVKYQRHLLPLYEEQEDNRNSGQPGWQTLQYGVNEIKQAPYADMRKRLILDYATSEPQELFVPPSQSDIDLLAEHHDWLSLTRFTRSQSRTHLQQLQAIGAYMEAMQSRSEPSNQTKQSKLQPVQHVAEVLSVSPVRARNLIQFSRDNGYLKGGSKGTGQGLPTKKAVDLANQARDTAAAYREEAKRK